MNSLHNWTDLSLHHSWQMISNCTKDECQFSWYESRAVEKFRSFAPPRYSNSNEDVWQKWQIRVKTPDGPYLLHALAHHHVRDTGKGWLQFLEELHALYVVVGRQLSHLDTRSSEAARLSDVTEHKQNYLRVKGRPGRDLIKILYFQVS